MKRVGLDFDIEWRLKSSFDRNLDDKYIKLYNNFKDGDPDSPDYIRDAVFIHRHPNAKLILYQGLGHDAIMKRQFMEDILSFLTENTS